MLLHTGQEITDDIYKYAIMVCHRVGPMLNKMHFWRQENKALGIYEGKNDPAPKKFDHVPNQKKKQQTYAWKALK